MEFLSMFTMHLRLLCVFICAFLLASVEPRAKLDYETRSALAQEHSERVLFKVMCGVPQPRVFKLATSEMRAVPPATIIHRCGESTGCCDFDYEKCVAKKKHHVTLYAFVKPRLGDGSFARKRNGRNRIKKFVFTNHTECHCVDAGRFILK
ncbi:PDGF_2 domain-containing protein [Caerostris darwini]|uniref:PDGF_2 domain-containing protein n=1 Tax=Caerostris darwini TaxID=1538125 RepID=A0AAV4TNE3_9ARAC|nr:PDGF_2 domain-containing protein [Caerostris darwini]